MPDAHLKPHHLIRGLRLLILLFFMAVALLVSRHIPPFESSDEAEHFLYVHTLIERGALPVIQSRDDLNQAASAIDRWNNQSHHAPLYYLISARLIAHTERADIADYLIPNDLIFIRGVTEANHHKWLHLPTYASDTGQAVWILRYANIMLGLLTLCGVYLAAKQVTCPPALPLMAMLFVACIPTFVIINSSVTNDALVVMLATYGTVWALRVLRLRRITHMDIALIAVLVAASALTKLTGVALIGVVGVALLLGWQRGDWSLGCVLQTGFFIGVTLLVVAGWWYVRNWDLYGDPFALAATQGIWGREFDIEATSFTEQVLRVGRSFWMLVGYRHQPVYAPDAYNLYVSLVAIAGMIGGVLMWRRWPLQLLLLMATCFISVLLLILGTGSVDISYGRLLMPAIAAFGLWVAMGWWYLLRRWAWVLLVPLLPLVVVVPLQQLNAAYPAFCDASPPDNALRIDAQTGALTIQALRLHDDTAMLGESVGFDLYWRGGHDSNPALLVTAVDSATWQRLGHVEIYPAMAAMRYLPDDSLYCAPVRVPLDALPDALQPPRQAIYQLRWYSPSQDLTLPFADDHNTPLEIMGATVLDGRYAPPPASYETAVNYGDVIVLTGYDLSQTALNAGETLSIGLHWQTLAAMTENWVLTVQLLDDNGQLIAQTDGVVAGYPTTAWRENAAFVDWRTLTIPATVTTGDYHLHVGWYRLSDFARLPIVDAPQPAANDLYRLPQRITVQSANPS